MTEKLYTFKLGLLKYNGTKAQLERMVYEIDNSLAVELIVDGFSERKKEIIRKIIVDALESQ